MSQFLKKADVYPSGAWARAYGQVLLLGLLYAASCADHNEALGKVEHALAVSGPWQIPPDVVAAGDAQHVEYTGAGPWIGEAGCGGGQLPGTQALADWLQQQFPQIYAAYGYSCRAIVGNSSRTSVHGTGRALDLMLPLAGGEADNDLGDPIANYLIEHAEEIGVQYIIWDRWSWRGSRSPGDKSRSYGGSHPHHDHLHVEITPQAADMMTPWFSGDRATPSSNACAVPPAGAEIDESEPCAKLYGNSQYWRRVSDSGHNGSLVWTNAYQNSTPGNWARWQLNVEQAGRYEVAAFIPPGFGMHRQTRYAVMASGSEHEVMLDQSMGSGWRSLGVFSFAQGEGQHVSVFDNNTSAVPSNQQIVVDAIRVQPEGTSSLPPPLDPPGDRSGDAGTMNPDAPQPNEPDPGQPSPGQPGEPEPDQPLPPPSEPSAGGAAQPPFGDAGPGFAGHDAGPPPVTFTASGSLVGGCAAGPDDAPPVWLLLLAACLVRRQRR